MRVDIQTDLLIRMLCVCQLLHFCKFIAKPIDLELDCIFGKPMKRRFQRCIVRTENLSTSHARIEYISVKNHAIETIGPTGDKQRQNPRFPLSHVDPHLVHERLVRPHSPPQMKARSVHALLHNYATNASLVIIRCPNLTHKTALPLLTIITPSNIPILNQPHSPPETISRSNQPFCHNTLCRPTDRWSSRMLHNMSAPLSMLIESDGQTSPLQSNLGRERCSHTTRLRNKVPIGYNRTPHIHPKTATSPKTALSYSGFADVRV